MLDSRRHVARNDRSAPLRPACVSRRRESCCVARACTRCRPRRSSDTACSLPAVPALLVCCCRSSAGSRPEAVLIAVLRRGARLDPPAFVIKRRGAQRHRQIDLEMPELVDLLVTTVEAGIGFAAALQLVARRVEGPAGPRAPDHAPGAEHGPDHREALQNMLERVESARSSVRASDDSGRISASRSARSCATSRSTCASAGDSGGGTGAEGADEDPLPARLPHSPGDLHPHPGAGARPGDQVLDSI